MSRGYSERVTAWQVWRSYNKPPDGLTLIGYVHESCGRATVVGFGDFDDVYDGTCCVGCGFEVAHPERDAIAIYRTKDGER